MLTIRDLEIIAVADPAGGRPTNSGSKSSIIVLGRDPDTDFRFVLEAWAERCYTDRLTDMIFLFQRKYRCRRFGIETVSGFRLYADSVRKEAREKRIRGMFVDINTNTHTLKETKIRDTISIELSKRRLFINPDHKDLLSELQGFPTTPTMDLVDALAMAIQLLSPLADGGSISYTNSDSNEDKSRLRTYAPGLRFT